MKTTQMMPGATLVLERNGEVYHARVDAFYDGEKYLLTVRQGQLPDRGVLRGNLHWTFPEGVLTQALEITIISGKLSAKPIEAIRRFQRRRERRFNAAFPIRIVGIVSGKKVAWEGKTRDISLHGWSAEFYGDLSGISHGMFLEFQMTLPSGCVEGVGRIVDIRTQPHLPVVVRLRVSANTENGFSNLQEWLKQHKKEEPV